MAKNKINRISNTINFIGIAVEGFNWYAYQSKIKITIHEHGYYKCGCSLRFLHCLKIT